MSGSAVPKLGFSNDDEWGFVDYVEGVAAVRLAKAPTTERELKICAVLADLLAQRLREYRPFAGPPESLGNDRMQLIVRLNNIARMVPPPEAPAPAPPMQTSAPAEPDPEELVCVMYEPSGQVPTSIVDPAGLFGRTGHHREFYHAPRRLAEDLVDVQAQYVALLKELESQPRYQVESVVRLTLDGKPMIERVQP